MKVWEVIAALSKYPAGADVIVARGEDTHRFFLDRVSDSESESDQVVFIGDGSEPDDESIDK